MITYAKKERARHWPIAPELMAQYKDGSHTYISNYGYVWLKNCKTHRDGDKPAFIGRDGTLEWYKNGKWHRDDDKPAIIGEDGTLYWFQDDIQHRFRGPAVIYPNGTLEWFIYDKNITKEVKKWLNGEKWCGKPEQIFEFQLRFL